METTSQKTLTRFDKKLIDWGKRSGKREGERGILLEGIKLVEEAAAANHPFKRAWHTQAFRDACPGLLKRMEGQECEIVQVSQRLMNSISDLGTAPGLAVVASEPGFIHRKPGDRFSLIVAISLIQDPGNLGGVIRTADYFGADELWLGKGSVDPYSPKVIRGSMGAIFRLPVLRPDNLKDKIRKFKKEGAQVWAAVPHDGEAESRVGADGSRILLIGSESRGLDPEYLETADRRVSIPGARRSESLNLAVAAGILIYSATTGRYK